MNRRLVYILLGAVIVLVVRGHALGRGDRPAPPPPAAAPAQ